MKVLFLSFFLMVFSASFAQQHATENTQCQMAVDEILRTQSFDIDDPVSEKARGVVRSIYEDLNAFYDASDKKSERKANKEALKTSIDKAKELDLDITMFKEDFDHIFK